MKPLFHAQRLININLINTIVHYPQRTLVILQQETQNRRGNIRTVLCIGAAEVSSQCVLGLCMSGAFSFGFVVPVEIN